MRQWDIRHLAGVALTGIGLLTGCATGIACANDTPSTAPTSAQSYHISRIMSVGGEGKWDYIAIDPATKMLFVPRSTHTFVVRSDTGQVVQDIPNTQGCHGVALVPDADRGFISDGKSKSVTVFDLKTFKVLGVLPAGDKPDAIIYDPFSKMVMAFNGESQNVSVIDPKSDLNASQTATPATTIPLTGKPEYATSDQNGHVYVNLEDANQVDVIDTKTMRVTDHWKIEGGDEPTGMAIDIAAHRLYIGCHNGVMVVIDTQSGKTLGSVPIGKGVDACGFDAATHLAFASCGDGTLTVARESSPGKFEVVQTVKTVPGARTMCIDPTTHIVYLPAIHAPLAVDKSSGATVASGAPTFSIVVVYP